MTLNLNKHHTMFGKEQRMLIYTRVGPVKYNKVHSSVLAN